MRVKISRASIDNEFLREVAELSGENVWACYQCGNCSAGCPLSFAMDVLPSQVIRLLSLGQHEEVFRANAIWLCASCLTCMTRCPRGVDLSRINDAVRHLAMKRGKAPDWFGPAETSTEVRKQAPPQALVSVFRKLSA